MAVTKRNRKVPPTTTTKSEKDHDDFSEKKIRKKEGYDGNGDGDDENGGDKEVHLSTITVRSHSSGYDHAYEESVEGEDISSTSTTFSDDALSIPVSTNNDKKKRRGRQKEVSFEAKTESRESVRRSTNFRRKRDDKNRNSDRSRNSDSRWNVDSFYGEYEEEIILEESEIEEELSHWDEEGAGSTITNTTYTPTPPSTISTADERPMKKGRSKSDLHLKDFDMIKDNGNNGNNGNSSSSSSGGGSIKSNNNEKKKKIGWQSSRYCYKIIFLYACINLLFVSGLALFVLYLLGIFPPTTLTNEGVEGSVSTSSSTSITTGTTATTTSTTTSNTITLSSTTVTSMQPHAVDSDLDCSDVNENSNNNNEEFFPHVTTQCECNDEIVSIPNSVQVEYDRLVQDFILPKYGTWNHNIRSCHPNNKSLVYMAAVDSSGSSNSEQDNNKDSNNDDLLQLYLLTNFYYQLNGPQWSTQWSWLSNNYNYDDKYSNFCSWYGLACNNENQLIEVNIPDNDLIGQIPADFFSLNWLQTFSVAHNALTGTIPIDLFNLSRLQTLDLSSNRLTGPILPTTATTSERQQFANLEYLNLYENLLEGSIPTEPFTASLRYLNLGKNILEGDVPTELLLQSTALEVLIFEDNNKITGQFPISHVIQNLESLETLSLSNTSIQTRLYDPTRTTFLRQGSSSSLQELDLSHTLVGGDIPRGFLASTTNLRHLDLSGSRFRKNIPREIGYLTELEYLALDQNMFEGAITTELGLLTNLRILHLDGNMFRSQIPTELGQLSSLETLTMDSNSLTGRMPQEICSLRAGALQELTAKCPTHLDGVLCPIPSCCTNCIGSSN